MPSQSKLTFSELRAAHRLARRQARIKRILSKNAFAGALDQPIRWHLYYDGIRVLSAVCTGTGKMRSWVAGPRMGAAEFLQPEILLSRAKEILRQQRKAGLGVILHLADQLDQGIVQNEFDNPELFEQANAAIREHPGQVVADLSDDLDPSIQWRYYPLLSAQRAAVLRLQIKALNALERLTELDIKAAVHAAPVEKLALYLKVYEQPSEEKPHCFVLFYDRFTVVAPVHHGVLDFKVLPHRQQDTPATFGDDLFSLLEKVGFVDSCVLLLVPCGTNEPTLLFHELEAYARNNQKNTGGIEIQIPDQEAFWSVLNDFAHAQLKATAIQRPEFLSEYREWSGKEFPLSLNIEGTVQRFWILSRANFWPDNEEFREKKLPKSLAILMVGLRLGRIAGMLLLLGFIGWFAFRVVTAYQSEALRVLPELVGGNRAEFDSLTSTKQYLVKWDKILRPRSQAWSTMEFVLGLLPEGKDILFEKLDYALKQAESQLANRSAGGAPGGLSRQWSIDGLCNDQGLADLERLKESSVLTAAFNSTATRLDDSSFAVTGNRTVKADLREESNSRPGPAAGGAALPYKFRLVVIENIPGTDLLALPVLPKPKKTAMQR